MVSSHDFVDDKRNKNIKIYINGKFYKRKDAKISVFDSSTMLGDGIWDSLRYHNDNFIFTKWRQGPWRIILCNHIVTINIISTVVDKAF